MTARVSVIIPSFNHAPFVAQSIQSVLDQSFQDFEIVITDDGSSDETVDVIRKFRDPRIDLEVSPVNRGAAAAENAAISRSRGEFIAILSSDDYFLPEKLAMQVWFLDEHPDVAAVFGLPRRVDERGNPLAGLGEFTLPMGPHHQSRQDWLRVFFFAGNCLCHPTVLIRRTAFDDCGLYDPRLASVPDFEMWVRLALRHQIHVLQRELTAFRLLDGGRNESALNPRRARRAQFEMFQVLKHFRKLSADEIRSIFAAEIARFEIDPSQSAGPLLAELASHGPTPSHQLFALDTLFEAAQSAEHFDYTRVHQMALNLNPFGFK